jgi:murein DD-endopeptidase MepM/ murein hydrolase activator NlpD
MPVLPIANTLSLLGLWLAAGSPADAGAGAPAVASPESRCSGWRATEATVRGSIAASLGAALGEDGSQVAAHFARIFMWDLDLRRDVVPGDQLKLLWRRTDAGEVEIGAARYQSQRLGKTLRAHRYRAAGDAFASYWDPEGQEVARRLKESPLASYEQITALLKDRPTHKGMDFKTAVGTEVKAPRAATVTRSNWKLRGNGNCLELRFADGTTAKFLHLSALQARPGARVRAGQVIGLTGNTGHSTAPHLHYQLERGKRTIDPVDYHGTLRRQLPPAERTTLQAEMAALARACGPQAP